MNEKLLVVIQLLCGFVALFEKYLFKLFCDIIKVVGANNATRMLVAIITNVK